jgi:hypothetical protein
MSDFSLISSSRGLLSVNRPVLTNVELAGPGRTLNSFQHEGTKLNRRSPPGSGRSPRLFLASETEAA